MSAGCHCRVGKSAADLSACCKEASNWNMSHSSDETERTLRSQDDSTGLNFIARRKVRYLEESAETRNRLYDTPIMILPDLCFVLCALKCCEVRIIKYRSTVRVV